MSNTTPEADAQLLDAPDQRDLDPLRFSDTGEGYQYVADTSPHEGVERPVYLHRLAAVAWGILDSLADDEHVHHEILIPWYNVEENLTAVQPDDHRDYHLHR